MEQLTLRCYPPMCNNMVSNVVGVSDWPRYSVIMSGREEFDLGSEIFERGSNADGVIGVVSRVRIVRLHH